MDYGKLKAELDSDPGKLGYAGKKDAEIAGLLNAVNQPVARTSITAAELWENTALAEYSALTAAGRQAYDVLISLGSIDVAVGTNSREALAALFPQGSVTREKLLALVNKSLFKSRAEILGLGAVAAGHIPKARAWR